MWTVFVFIIIGITLYILAMLSIKFQWELTEIFIFWGTVWLLMGLIFMIPTHNDTVKEKVNAAYKEVLVKDNPYKMVIQYELKDSVYVPADTIFVLK